MATLFNPWAAQFARRQEEGQEMMPMLGDTNFGQIDQPIPQTPTQAQNTASGNQPSIFEMIKNDPSSAALLAGLSILRNNRNGAGLGELLGQAGMDTLGGLAGMQRAKTEQERQKDLSEYRKLQSEGMRGQISDAQRQRDLRLRYASGDRSPEVLNGLFGKEIMQRQWAQEDQDRAFANQRELANLSFQQRMALQDRAARFAAQNRDDKGQYDYRLGGYVRPDGSFVPVQLPEGYTPPTKEAEYLPVNSSAINEARSLNEAWNEISRVGNAYDEGFAKYGEKGPGVGQGTGFDVNMMGVDAANRIDPAGTGIRSAISQMSSVIMNQLSGAAVSEMERKRLEGFLPTYKDDEKTLYEKLNGYTDYINSKANAWRDTYGTHRVLSGIAPKRFERKRSETNKPTDVPPPPPGFIIN